MKFNGVVLFLVLFISQIMQIPAADLENNSIMIKPAFELPMGEKSSVFNEDAAFKPGGSMSFTLQYIPPNLPLFYFNGILGYSLFPTQAENLSVISAGFGSGLNLRIGNVLSLSAGAELGWYVGMYPDSDPGSFYHH